jgi:hypothetical protein
MGCNSKAACEVLTPGRIAQTAWVKDVLVAMPRCGDVGPLVVLDPRGLGLELRRPCGGFSKISRPAPSRLQALSLVKEYNMPDDSKGEVRWGSKPEDQDYPGAADYLSLLGSEEVVASVVAALKDAPIQHRKAKDILRAARLVLLPEDNAHVASDLNKIKKGKKLSPILMVKGDLARGIPAQVADGYHRVCASYYTNENTDIPLKLADAPR